MSFCTLDIFLSSLPIGLDRDPRGLRFLCAQRFFDHANALRSKLQNRETIFRFYIRRALRLYPIYFLVLALLILAGSIPFPGFHAFYFFNWKLFSMSLAKNESLARFVSEWRVQGTCISGRSTVKSNIMFYSRFYSCRL